MSLQRKITMNRCTFEYNLDSPSMGRVGFFTCHEGNINTFHGSLIINVIDKYNYCPFCGKEIKLKNKGKANEP